MFGPQIFRLHPPVSPTVMAIAAAAFFVSATTAGEPEATVPLAIVGSPRPVVVIRDALHCRADLAPSMQPTTDRVEFQVRPDAVMSIALSEQRGKFVCGGSISFVPTPGLGYAARLTPACAEELFRIDPHAEPPALLLRSDQHLQDSRFEDLICATRRGGPGSSRFSVGGKIDGIIGAKVEIGTDGSCGKFARAHLEETPSVELAPGVKHWVRLTFPDKCELKFAFTPSAGNAYFVQRDERRVSMSQDRLSTQIRCEARVLRVDAADTISPVPLEREPISSCLF